MAYQNEVVDGRPHSHHWLGEVGNDSPSFCILVQDDELGHLCVCVCVEGCVCDVCVCVCVCVCMYMNSTR